MLGTESTGADRAPNRRESSGRRCADIGRTPLSLDDTAAVARALGHPARLVIVRELAKGEPRIAGDIVKTCDLAPSTVSEHLRILRDACIVLTRRDGSRVWYRLNPDVLNALSDVLSGIADD